jgi:hypothetical protein
VRALPWRRAQVQIEVAPKGFAANPDCEPAATITLKSSKKLTLIDSMMHLIKVSVFLEFQEPIHGKDYWY